MMSSIHGVVLPFISHHKELCIGVALHMRTCIAMHRYGKVVGFVTEKPWVAAVNRLLRAELRPNPRPKPHTPASVKYWNNEDLATAAGIRANTLSDVMRGKRDPAVTTIRALAEALKVTPATLLMDADEAAAYAVFQQTHATTQQTTAIEDTVRRMLEAEAERRSVEWVEHKTKEALAVLNSHAPQLVAEQPVRQKRKTR